MKLGTSTRAIWNIENLEALRYLKKVGYDEVELWVEYPRLSLDLASEEEILEIRNELDNLNLEVSVHAPIRDLNLSSLNYGNRREAVRQISDSIRFARKIGSPVVIIHPGRNTSQKDPFSMTEECFYESLSAIVKVAEEEGIILAMENMEKRKGEYILTPRDMIEVKNRINSDNLKFTFDIAHAYTITDDIVGFYREIMGDVVHIHISDNLGYGSKTHMKMGEGEINFREILEEVYRNNFDGYITIEGYYPEAPEKTVEDNIKFLRDIVEDIKKNAK